MTNLTDLYIHIRKEQEADVRSLLETISEFSIYHKKHIFDADTSIAIGYESAINGMKRMIKNIEDQWKN